ncbi:MAG: tetratricopeptide repeat protein [Planctomycetota bacterium]
MKPHLWIALALVLATLFAYEPVRNNGFISFDDNFYLTQNPQVQAGLGLDGVRWAFTTGHSANWHPLTWLSHMLDVSLWGMDARGHHVTSVLLHAASVVLLFFLLRRMTGETGKSAFVAAAFAVHPLHVESVAWVAERKDVLSALLGLLTLQFWVAWTKEGGRLRYVASIVLFALGLMAKPMLVTLPFLMLLLDAWPLARLDRGTARARIVEKLPFFALALLSCIVTYLVQQRGFAVIGQTVLPLSFRFGNAGIAYVTYLGKAVWPVDLAFFYPYPPMLSAVKAVLSGILVLTATALVLYRAHARPWLAVGWFWWLGMLVPVIGIVQVGRQSLADRYMYLPLVGLAVLAAWGTDSLFRGRGRAVRVALAIAVVGAWTFLTRAQSEVWKDDFSLFGHAVAVTEENAVAHDLLGTALADQGRLDEALSEYRQAILLAPRNANYHTNMGIVLAMQGRLEEALESYRAALSFEPNLGNAYLNQGVALANLGRLDEAIESVSQGVRLRPDRADAVVMLEQMREAKRQAESAPR